MCWTRALIDLRPISMLIERGVRAFLLGGFLENSTVLPLQFGSVSRASTCAEPASHLAKKVFPCGTTGGAHRRSSRAELLQGGPGVDGDRACERSARTALSGTA